MAKAKLTQSESQLALTLVQQSAAAREARRKASPLDRADLAGDPHLRDNRRALAALLASHVVKSGLDLERLEQINAKNQGDLQRVGEARKAAAVKESRSTMEALRQGVATRRKALEYLANKATPATSFPNVVLESPIMITRRRPGPQLLQHRELEQHGQVPDQSSNTSARHHPASGTPGSIP